MNQHDHSISWMLAGGLRAQEERDRGFLRAVAEARAAERGPGLVDRIRARLDRRPAEGIACCQAPFAA